MIVQADSDIEEEMAEMHSGSEEDEQPLAQVSRASLL